jgi:hypothetical protein
MAIPSDPDYRSPAPPDVQAHSELFRTLLSMNDDPYAAHSRNEGMIQTIESNLTIPAEP